MPNVDESITHHLRTLPLSHAALPTPARPAYWLGSAAAAGAFPPLCLAQDLGALLTQPRARLALAPDGARGLARPPYLPEDVDTAPYLAWLTRLAAHPLLREVSGWDISDAVAGVLLARLCEGVDFPPIYGLPLAPALDATRRLAAELERADPARVWRETPAGARPVLGRLLPPPAMAQVEANLRGLDGDELRFLHRYGPRLAGAPDPRTLLDLFNLTGLGGSARLALGQVLRLLPRVAAVRRAGDVQTYAMGGYAGLTRQGSLDSLVPTELAYPGEVFLHRVLNREALYYGREAEREGRRELAYVVTQAGPELAGDGEVLARALTLALGQVLGGRGYTVRQSFVGSAWTAPEGLGQPGDVQRVLYYRDGGPERAGEMLRAVREQMRRWGGEYREQQVYWVVGAAWDAEGWEAHRGEYRALREEGGQQAWFVRMGDGGRSGNGHLRPPSAGCFGRWEVVESGLLWAEQAPPTRTVLTPLLRPPRREWEAWRDEIEGPGFVGSARDVFHLVDEARQLAAWEKLAAVGSEGENDPDQAAIDDYLRGLAPEGMVYVPAGVFLMGSADDDPDASDNEKPQHEVGVPGYYIGRYPVTNEEYARFIEAEGYRTQEYWTQAGWMQIERNSWGEPRLWHDERFNGPRQPVVGVSWYEAVAYCRWAGGRLPTEAEWEKAASWVPPSPPQTGGIEGGRKRRYPWGDEWEEARGNWGRKVGHTTPVGEYPEDESAYGVREQAGNVDEWCSTRWSGFAYPYRDKDGREDLGGGDDVWRVIRGAGWWGDMDNARAWARCAYRIWNIPRYGYNGGGLRLVAPRRLPDSGS